MDSKVWAVVQQWYGGAYEGFGILVTEECEEIVAWDALVGTDLPLQPGDRVLIDDGAGADGSGTMRLVKVR
ncbi:hypothetical protein [Antrihabitans spumae]|jgi:hypothetical protein|uniref:Uncharacterized protein n=1 Tax=Antrihabitans spumae TaxID=3373370 RepID=A0ABW7KSV0_9NOCA